MGKATIKVITIKRSLKNKLIIEHLLYKCKALNSINTLFFDLEHYITDSCSLVEINNAV